VENYFIGLNSILVFCYCTCIL